MLVKLQTTDARGVVLDVAGYVNSGPPTAVFDGTRIDVSYRCRGQCDCVIRGTVEEMAELEAVIARALSRHRQRDRTLDLAAEVATNLVYMTGGQRTPKEET